MKAKTIITTVCIAVSIIGSAFFSYKYGKESTPINHIEELQNEIDRLQAQVKSKKLSPRDQYVLNSINKYGINNVIALALNGRYECPSGNEQIVDKCNIREEIAVMFATLNLANAEKKTIEQTVYHKQPNGVYWFSWIPTIGNNKDTTSNIFKHSLELAFKVLGGDNSVRQYNYEQQFYCRTSKSKCGWHNTSKNLAYLGRLNLSNQETRQDFIKETELSYHTFWGRK